MYKKIVKYIKKNIWFVVILILGAFLRIYKFKEFFLYTHDNDLAGWFVKDVVINKHLRLIGQETSTHGIFIGPLFYYLLVPFYLFFGLDPIGGTFLVCVLGIFTIWSFYFVFSKVFDKKVGLISALLYSVSYYGVFNDREVVPTMPVILWTVWLFYTLHLFIKGKHKSGYLLTGILLGLIWHFNVALILLTPTLIISIYLSKKRFSIKKVVPGIVIFLVLISPLLLFELRHGFPQFKALFLSLTTDQQDIISGLEKVKRVFYLAGKNLAGVLWGPFFNIKYEIVLFVLFVIFLYQTKKKYLATNLSKLIFVWILSYLVFFSSYSKIVSEYYLNGLIVPFIVILSLMIVKIFDNKSEKYLSVLIMSSFVFVNLYRFIVHPVNRSGYVERKAVISEIKKDSIEKGFDCVSVSYITDPGYSLGYRYFLWLLEVKTKKISNKIPVYTIVFPLKPIFKTDKSFGAIGLIYPDYDKYVMDEINKNCEGDDFNLTDSMFGFN